MNEQQAQAIEREADNIPLQIGFKRLSENAVIPKRNNDTDSGFDVYAAEDVIVRPGDTVVVKTDIAVILPPYHEAYIKNRSGVASKTKLRVVSPPIDEEYRGAVGVIVDNTAQMQYYIDSVDEGTLYTESEGTVLTLCGEQVIPKGSWLGQRYELGTYLIRKGDRIAQLTVQPRPNVVSYEVTDELNDTSRGTNGFGSSGV